MSGGTCPNCFEHLDSLWYAYLQWELGNYSLDRGGWGTCDQRECGDFVDSEYMCPHCFHLLTNDGDEADAFLEGEGVWTIIW